MGDNGWRPTSSNPHPLLLGKFAKYKCMAKSSNKPIEVGAILKQRVETTYEYTPIIGEVLGYWRKIKQGVYSEEIHLHLNTPLIEYDKIFINGEEVELGNIKGVKRFYSNIK